MDIMIRVNILKDAGQLSQENYETVKNVIALLETKHKLLVTDESASQLITHLCAALERIDKGETVAPVDSDVYAEFTKEAAFSKASAISKELVSLIGKVPAEEGQYLTIHIATLLTICNAV